MNVADEINDISPGDESVSTEPVIDISPDTDGDAIAAAIDAEKAAAEPVVETPATEPVAKADDIDDDTLWIAQQEGIPEAEARALGSRKAVMAVVRGMKAVKARAASEAANKTIEKEPDIDLSVELPEKLKETLDPEFLKWIADRDAKAKQALVQMRDRAKTAEDRANAVTDHAARQAAEEAFKFVDGFFADESRADLYGTLSGSACRVQEPLKFQNRTRTLEIFDAIQSSPALRKIVGDREAAMQAAYRMAFPDHAERSIKKSVTSKVESRSKQIIGKPGAKTERISDPNADLNETIRSFSKKTGTNSGLDDGEE